MDGLWRTLLMTLAIGLASSAFAAAPSHSKAARRSKSSADTKLCDSPNTQDIIDCGVASQKKAEARMNGYYDKMRTRLRPESRELLDDSQRKWVSYRDAYCKLEATGAEGGTIQPWVVAECMQGMAASRADELKPYVKCDQGDLSCPY